ncbi:MAG: hypothetical protein SPG28_02325, partial [Alloprevotella sp.]|nr:hypothetical protein [Alloprevotella sp.]
RQFSCKQVQSRTIALSQMSKIEFTRILPWRAIALLRTCSGYAERSRKCQEKVHLYERLCKARAETKFTWTMPSRRQTSVENEQKIPCIISHYLQVSRNKIIFASY